MTKDTPQAGEGKTTGVPEKSAAPKAAPGETMNALYRRINNGAGSFKDLRAFILGEEQVMRSLKPESERYKEHKAYLDKAVEHEAATLTKAHAFLAGAKPAPSSPGEDAAGYKPGPGTLPNLADKERER